LLDDASEYGFLDVGRRNQHSFPALKKPQLWGLFFFFLLPRRRNIKQSQQNGAGEERVVLVVTGSCSRLLDSCHFDHFVLWCCFGTYSLVVVLSHLGWAWKQPWSWRTFLHPLPHLSVQHTSELLFSPYPGSNTVVVLRTLPPRSNWLAPASPREGGGKSLPEVAVLESFCPALILTSVDEKLEDEPKLNENNRPKSEKLKT